MPDDPYLIPRKPADIVHSVAQRAGITPDIADDYLALTQIESGHNVNVRNSSKGARGFGQVMPDVKGGTIRTVGNRKYDLTSPAENIEAGLRYFQEGGSDPVARRLHYFGGPRARQTYERTGRIPNISDGNMTAEQYVRATGGYRQAQQDPYLVAKPSQPAPSTQTVAPVDDPYLVAKSSGQTLPPQTSPEQRQQPPSTPVIPTLATPVPSITDALDQITASVNLATKTMEGQATRQPISRPVNPLFQQLGQQRTVDETRRQQETQAREEAKTELASQRGPYGSPTLTGMLNIAAHPVDSLTGIFTSDEDKISKMTAEKLRAQQLAAEPEVTSIRKEYGAMPAAARSVVAPLARGGAGMLHIASGLAELGGMLPKGWIPPADQLSDWAKKRAEIIEAGAVNTPLRESRNLSSLVTGDTQLEEVQRGVPEKVATGLADLGIGIGQIVLLRKVTGLSLPKLLALEGAAKAADKPVGEQLAAATEGYALGSALSSHLGRGASAALFGAPTAAQTGYEVVQGRMSPVDAAIQTGTQALTGAAMGGEGVGALLQRGRRAETPMQARLTDLSTDAGSRGEVAATPVTSEPSAPLRETKSSPRRFESVGDMLSYEKSLSEAEQDAFRHAMFADEAVQKADAEWLAGGDISNLSEAHRQFAERYFNQRDTTTGDYLNESQTEVQSPAAAQREAVESAGDTPRMGSPSQAVSQFTAKATQKTPATDSADAATVPSQRFYHRDFGEVSESPNQRRVGKGRVRVVAEDGVEHVIKRASLTGAGNQRAVPIREPEPTATPDIDPYLEPQGRPNLPVVFDSASGRRAVDLPPNPSKDFIRLYRGEPLSSQRGYGTRQVGDAPENLRGQWWTTDPQEAADYAAANDVRGGGLTYVDIPAADAQSYTAKNAMAGQSSPFPLRENEYVLPHDVAQRGIGIPSRAALDTESERPYEAQRVVPKTREHSQGQPTVEPAQSPATESPSSLQQKGELTTRVQSPEEGRPPSDNGTRVPLQSTAPKNAAMDADRAELGLPELEHVKGASAQQVLDNATEANRADPRRPDILVEQALRGGRNFTDTETMQVNLRAAEVKNDIAKLKQEIVSATNDATVADKSIELESRIDEFARLSEAQQKAGKEWSQAGRARQRAVDENLSLIEDAVAGFRRSAKRKETPTERVEIEQRVAKEIETLAKIEKANERIARERLQDEINKTTRRQRLKRTAKSLNDEFAQLQAQFAAARAETRGIQPGGLASLDPEGKLTRLIAKMTRNRIEAGVNKAEALVDEVYEAIKDHLPASVTKRDVRDAISGYSATSKTTRSEAQKRLDALRSELQSLSKTEDVAAGKRSPRQEGPQGEFRRDQSRQRAIAKELADLERRLSTGDFSDKPQREPPRYTRETFRLQKALEKNRADYEQLKYNATATRGRKALDTTTTVLNVPKTALTIGDVSAVGRQGGFLGVLHPVINVSAIRDMARSVTPRMAANVQTELKAHKDYDLLKRMGVEFTGDETGFRREEGYLGSAPLKKIPGVKQVTEFSEDTFTNMLDAQRLKVGSYLYDQLRNPSKFARTFLGAKPVTPESDPQAFEYIAKHINDATGRGHLGKRFQSAAPLLNAIGFSPRLVKSRFALLNKMFNPFSMYNMPPEARRLVIQDNVKFLGLVMSVGALVNTATPCKMEMKDWDDADFLKIRCGDAHFDGLMGLQQPMRFMLRLGSAVVHHNDPTYAGGDKGDIVADFGRSKASPIAGQVWDYLEGKNRLSGKKFEFKQLPKELLTPLPVRDFWDAIKQDGALLGAIEATPSLFGIGVQSYAGAAEKPSTHAEKLARKLARPDKDSARTQDEIDTDAKRARLRARSRTGENINAELVELLREGKVTGAQAKRIKEAKGRTRLSEDLRSLGADEALNVYSVMNADERRVSAASIRQKIANSKADAEKKRKFRERARELGLVQ